MSTTPPNDGMTPQPPASGEYPQPPYSPPFPPATPVPPPAAQQPVFGPPSYGQQPPVVPPATPAPVPAQPPSGAYAPPQPPAYGQQPQPPYGPQQPAGTQPPSYEPQQSPVYGSQPPYGSTQPTVGSPNSYSPQYGSGSSPDPYAPGKSHKGLILAIAIPVAAVVVIAVVVAFFLLGGKNSSTVAGSLSTATSSSSGAPAPVLPSPTISSNPDTTDGLGNSPSPIATPSLPDTSGSGDDLDSQALLQEVVTAAQANIETQLQQYSNVYSNITVAAKGSNTIVYTYTYKNQLTNIPSVIKSLEAQKPTMQHQFNSLVFPMLKDLGINNPTAEFIYKNADGSVIDDITLTAS